MFDKDSGSDNPLGGIMTRVQERRLTALFRPKSYYKLLNLAIVMTNFF